MSTFFLILIASVRGEWQVYYNGFHQSNYLNCASNTCPYSFKFSQTQTSALFSNCTNPIGTALILKSSQMMASISEQLNTLKANAINHILNLDVYFLTQWNGDYLKIAYKTQNYQFQFTTQNPLQFSLGGCNSSQHEVKTIQIALSEFTSMNDLKFSIVNESNLALIKNVHLSYYLCHPTCRNCTGDNYNQCTSCFPGVSLVDGICRCPIRTILTGGPPSDYRCLSFCLQTQTDRRERYCKAYETQNLLWLSLTTYSYAQLIQWNIIYDPANLSKNSKKLGQFFGVFKNNEGAYVTINTTQFLYPMSLQLQVLFCNATPINSGISIYINQTYYSSFYYNGANFEGDNMYIFGFSGATYTGCQKATKYILQTNLYVEQGNFNFSIKGNFTNSNSGWYIIYCFITSAQCPAFCLKCEKEYECSICQNGYKKVSDGKCVLSCPKDSLFLNNVCIKYDQTTKCISLSIFLDSQYYMRLFIDFTVPYNIHETFILESSTSKDLQKGELVYWSYISSKAVFGGQYVWATAKFSQVYTIDKPHHSLTIYFDAIFGCNFQSSGGYLKYSFNNIVSQVNSNQTVTITISQYSPTLSISFECFGQNNNVKDKYCAFSDYQIVVHYCSPFCLQCSDENTCTQMDTFDNQVIKLDPSQCGPQQYLDYQYFKCESCPQECEACFNEYECSQCIYPYKLYITKCILMCLTNQFFNIQTQLCEDCSFRCKQCRNQRDLCIHCEEWHYRYLYLNQCICYDGYYDDNHGGKCQVCNKLCKKCYGSSNDHCTQCIQLDKVEKKGDICDCQEGYYFDDSSFKCNLCHEKCQTCFSSFDNSCLSCNPNEYRRLQGLTCICLLGYYENNDSCQVCPSSEDANISQCYKKCGNQIIKWHNQLCDQITCQAGFQNVENQCTSICGDLLLSGDEECEDGNQKINDGCTNCKFQCPKQCLTCNLLTVFPCSDICGDGIISDLEECDDGNNIQFDGCYQCKLECQTSCTRCIRGLCYECLTYGWIINIDTLQCIENCGDSIVIGSEECDDGNNLDENDNCYQCKRLCRNDCKTCSPDGKICLDCQVIGFKPQSYYCVNTCGDGYLAVDPYGRNSEECDDFNIVANDGCSTTCKYQCQTTICKVCQNGKCLECIDHYYLNTNNNKCLEICNDNVKVGYEKCEDMNTLLYDGCYNCQLSCQPSCLNCQTTGCLQCQVGFRLIENKCQNICGDELIVSGEDCDDGNISPYDGCHFCQFHCGFNCQVCQSGRCLGCQLGFKLFNGVCVIQQSKKTLITQQEYLLQQNQMSQSYIQYCHYQINDICIICDDYYYLNANRSKCESKCGDNYINDLEQCEHNLIKNDIICSNCQFQCKDNCIECLFGLCQNCEQDYLLIEQTNECLLKSKCDPEYGLYYNILINQCYDICGDGVKSIYEECEDDNVDPYDGCFQCKYSCNPLCPLCIAGVCTDDGTVCQKGYYFDKSIGSCFSACGDEMKATDEECDLLNTRKCLNCKLIIDKNCKTLDENNQCLVCQDGFELLDELCEPKTTKKCDIRNCIACENNICIQYLTDATNNTNTNNNNNTLENLSQAKCGDGDINQNELCDDGNLINGDGCDSDCQPSKNSLCQLNECIQIFHPVPQLKFVKQIENCQVLTLFYDQKVKLSPGSTLEQYLNSLSGSIVNTKLNVTIEAKSKLSQDLDYFEILIKIQYLEKVVDPVFFLIFQNLSIIINEQELEQECQQLSLQLASPNFLSTEEQQTTVSLIQFSEYQIQIIVGLVIISSLSGKFQIIENQIEMMQMLYYYKYINIVKGQNLIKFFDTFKIIQLANLYKFIGFQPQSFSIFNVSQENSPSIFEDDGRTSNFLCTFLEILSIFFVAYFSHLFSQIIIR
ncbi:unnamed protein product (macronuclear) [Paramecium tetraurelia]|uniref:EGF-like domain-containing protein n=1 Tax=Paramecium tetraurelia TaxID=5888 RepID=A0BYC2_PARTE|nr:uncharacterized protein GSPATT00033392001 [Paramecium tetraurelia]CAK63539.1 unnamed protein product [Paramecium tetraurelia]|eukprot:XP_001430937.1 hypothetical protein (macronuclear) [Paramecium tetraurelia strain d4-2]